MKEEKSKPLKQENKISESQRIQNQIQKALRVSIAQIIQQKAEAKEEMYSKVKKRIRQQLKYLNLEERAPTFLMSQIPSNYQEGKIINVIGTLSQLGNIKSVEDFMNEDKLVQFADVALSDHGPSKKVAPVVDKKLILKIQELNSSVKKNYRFKCCCIQFPIDKKMYEKILFIIDVEPIGSTLETMNFTDEELALAKEKIKTNKESLKDFLLKQLITLLDIKNLENNIELRQSLEFAILQSVSQSRLNQANGKLHSLLIGPPASGKSLITKAISILNHIFLEAQPGKMTVAGISSRSEKVDSEYISVPGYIPNANRGVLAIQDFHSTRSRNELWGILSLVMESGVFSSSDSSKTEFETCTALHFDMNKASDIQAVSSSAYFENYDIPLQILSRFDFVIELSADSKLQYESSLKVLSKNTSKISEDESRKREKILKLITAIQLDHFPEITINKDVVHFVRTSFEKFQQENVDAFFKDDNLAAFQVRIVNSIRKLISASARLNSRSVAEIEDAEYALSFIFYKYRFLKNIIPKLSPQTFQGQEAKRHECLKYLKEKFMNEDFKTSEALQAREEGIEEGVSMPSERNIHRYLPKYATNLGHGKWKFDQN